MNQQAGGSSASSLPSLSSTDQAPLTQPSASPISQEVLLIIVQRSRVLQHVAKRPLPPTPHGRPLLCTLTASQLRRTGGPGILSQIVKGLSGGHNLNILRRNPSVASNCSTNRSAPKLASAVVEYVVACRAACSPESFFDEGERHARSGHHEAAISCYDQAIAKGFPRAHAAKAWILLNSQCNPDEKNAHRHDRQKARATRLAVDTVSIAQRGMALGCSCSKAVVAMCFLTGCGVQLNRELGSRLAKESAESGSKYGLYVLAWKKSHKIVSVDDFRSFDFFEHSKAKLLYERAAHQSFPDALFDLALMHLVLTPGHAAAPAAATYLKKAADVGHPAARYMLLENSADLPNADADALFRFALMCSALDGCQHPLASMDRYSPLWHSFITFSQSHRRRFRGYTGHSMAAGYLKVAALTGHAEARCTLASMHEDGRGVKQDDAEAAKYYRQAAVQGHADAMYKLAVMHCDGRFNIDNDEEAFRCLRMAADQGHVAAKCKLADMLCDEQGLKRDDEAAAKLYMEATDLGHPDSRCKLAILCSQGRCAMPKGIEAARLFTLAMQSGNKDACYQLAVMHEQGRNVPLNFSLAIRLYRNAAFGSCRHSSQAIEALRRAADPARNGQGDVEAQMALAGIFTYGLCTGVPADLFQAAKFYRMAALQGDATAQFKYAEMHACGAGCARDFQNAAHFFRLAADQGHAASQFALGVRFETGHGVKQDEVQASALFSLAALQGDVDAQFRLALMHEDGRGVKQDDAEAAKYYRQAAVQGHAEAMYKLAVMHREGRGVEREEAQAQLLFRQAADQGHIEAESEPDALADYYSDMSDGSGYHVYLGDGMGVGAGGSLHDEDGR